MIDYLVLAVLAVAVVILVAWPLLRPATERDRLDATSEAQRRRLALREERDLALEALRELEVDHATHHIGDQDYAELVARERARAAEAIRALDEELGTGPGGAR
ncbi:MAG: hypothetical protein ACO3KD_02350 [Gaiellales bacterium]